MSTEAKEKTDSEDKVEGKKAGKDAPPVNLGWDSHSAVVSFGRRSNIVMEGHQMVGFRGDSKGESAVYFKSKHYFQILTFLIHIFPPIEQIAFVER